METVTPYAQALALYRGDTRRFTDELEQHFLFGYVVATPDAFAMARPVLSTWEPSRIADITEVEPLETADAWYIWLLAGKLSVAARWLPVELPLIGLAQRGSAARFVAWERLKRLAGSGKVEFNAPAMPTASDGRPQA
jgi:hypothetical protein